MILVAGEEARCLLCPALCEAQLFALPGRLTRTARRWTLHLPVRWPWQTDFIEALTRIRALPA